MEENNEIDFSEIYTIEEIELEMIKFSILNFNPDISYDELEKRAIEELKLCYS